MPVIEATASAVKERSNGKEQMAGHAGDDGGARPAKRKRLTPSATRRASSAVTSGRKLFVLGDSNSSWSRRYSDLVRLHAQDLSGGVDLSQAQQSLIRRAAAIECELELMEGKLSLGQEVDLDLFTRSTSHLRRILETLGIERRPHNVTPPSLTELADTIEREAPAGRDVVTQPEPHDVETLSPHLPTVNEATPKEPHADVTTGAAVTEPEPEGAS